MKQFQKIGVAAAVASVAAGAVATEVSRSETGDLAIVPYYTVMDGTNTGIHIINTTDSTQVVKVRLRRGTDSKDAMDFNLVMSPRDEWTANIGAGGPNGVLITTNDTTCTVPEFPEGGAPMPPTFAEGATEGYLEIIGMAQTTDEKQPIAVAAKHAKGVPASCAAVRANFYRVAAKTAAGAAIPGVDATVRGTHTSNLTSIGSKLGCSATATTTGACKAGAAANLSKYTNTDDNAFKVSFMLTDPAGGLEAGDNAVMIEGFSSAPMMTNQQPLSFGTDGKLNYDPINFELPNLAYGATTSSDTERKLAMDATLTNGSMWTAFASAIDADAIANDWAAFDTADSSVNADWVVTLPGQYVMTNPICDIYADYPEASATAAAACVAATSTAAAAAVKAYAAAGGDDRNQLPLLVASNVDGGSLVSGSNMNLWDREELSLAGKESEKPPEEEELGFSPNGSTGDPADPDVVVPLPYEVNVIDFGEPDAPSALMSNLKLTVTPDGADRGWGRLDIESTVAASKQQVWSVAVGDAVGDEDDGDLVPSLGGDVGSWTANTASNIGVVGFAVWQRSFAEQAGNYGRMVEHSTIFSSGSSQR